MTSSATPAVPPLAIAAALAKAQAAVDCAEKRGKNPEDAYSYATADELVRVGKAAAAVAGLALLPMRYTVVKDDAGYDLVREFLLVHESGLVWSWSARWPIPAGKARDKALASALTSLLGYTYRDTFGIPRVMTGEEPMDQRRDDLDGEPVRAPAPKRESVVARKSRRSSARDARATAAFVGASLPVKPGLELGDEQREREAREDAEGARLTALAAADPAQPDPEWVRDEPRDPVDGVCCDCGDDEGPNDEDDDSGACASRSDGVHCVHWWDGNDDETPIPAAAVVDAGGGSNAPRADGPNPSAPAPGAGRDSPGVIHPEACWECDRHPCICAKPAQGEA